MRKSSGKRPASSHDYSVSLQQAAAAVFGVKLVDGDEGRKPPPVREGQRQQG